MTNALRSFGLFPSILSGAMSVIAASGCGGVSGLAPVGDDGGPSQDDGGPPDDPRCPSPSKVTDGASCSTLSLVCNSSLSVVSCDGSTLPISCFCDGSAWVCEQGVSGPCPEPACPAPSAVRGGVTCSPGGASCASTNLPLLDCNDVPTGDTGTGSCTCISGVWSCPPQPSCDPPPPPVVCPIASAVVPGAKCNSDPSLGCKSTATSSTPCGSPVAQSSLCSCIDGAWSCSMPSNGCLETCPAPASVRLYGSCQVDPGLFCQGAPRYCGGQPYADSFHCVDQLWQEVTTTVCNLDGEGGVPAVIWDAAVTN